MRHGVHGSSRPGFNTTGTPSANDGIHNAFTAGELLGKITPKLSVCTAKLTGTPFCCPIPWSNTSRFNPRLNPLMMTSISAKTMPSRCMFLRINACGNPLVAANWCK